MFLMLNGFISELNLNFTIKNGPIHAENCDAPPIGAVFVPMLSLLFPTRLKSTRDTETLENMRLRPFETTRLTIFEKVLFYAASGHFCTGTK